MSVNPPVAEILETGQKVKLEADVRDALGKQISGASVKWEALDPSVATVDFSGTVTGMNEGVAEIRGTFSGLSATAIVAVSRRDLRSEAGESVTVYPDGDTIATVGGVLRLLAVGRRKNGQLVGSSKLAWSSTNTSVATVEVEGEVTGRQSGTTQVVVRNGAAADTSHISVAPTDVATSIVITPRLDTIPVIGSSVTLGARVLNGSNEEMEDRDIGWISLDPSVATVSIGVVLGVKKGTARIVASHGSFQDTARVVVAPVQPVTSLYLTPKTDTIPQVGGSVTLKATLLDGTGATVSDQVTWGTMDPGVASVTQSGAVKGVTVGVARITAKYNALVDTASVWVSPPAPAPTYVVATTPATHAMAVGATVKVEASIHNSSGKELLDAQASWTSLDATVATVSTAGPIRGVDVKAIKVGTARIVAQYGGAADTTIVTVTGGVNGYTARLTPDTVWLAVTEADVFVDWFGYDASGKEVTSTFATWTSADPSIATVPPGPAGDAYVKAISPGVTHIVATWNGTVVTSTIIVGKAPGTASAWVEVTPSTSTIASVGGSTQLGVAAKDADGTAVNSSQVPWKSLDPATAAVNGSGLVSGVAQGTARIVAQYSGAADTATVTVLGGGTGGNGYTARLTPDTVRLTVSGPDAFVDWFGYDANGNEVTSSFPTWISVDPSIATAPADPGGHAYVKAISAGVTQVVATWNGVVVTATVIVQSATGGSGGTGPAGSTVAVSPSSATVTAVGGTVQLSVAAKDSSGAAVPSNQINWSSLDPSLAGVTSSGLVTSYAPGTARIMASYAAVADTAAIWTPSPGSGGGNLTPPDLRLALGPLVDRNTPAPGWPSGYESKLDAAINRLVSEVAAGSYDYIPDVADGDNPHYGPLRMVTMRNIRAGLPLNESEPGFAAALKITREWIRKYAIPNGNRLTLYRNTALIDAEIVYWVYRHDTGDNGILARQAREYIQVTSAWLSNNLTPAQENLDHHWMDTRTIALAIEAALAAQRVGWTFSATGASSYNKYVQTQYKPAGVNSWETWIGYVNGFIDRMQDATMTRFGGMNDPNGFPIIFGNIRYGQSGDWLCQSPPCTAYRTPYPFKPFMDAMTVNALLKAYRQQGSVHSQDNAIEMTAGIKQHYDPVRRTLPYSSHGTSAAMYFYMTNTDYVLNNFWVRPLLEMYDYTGQAWMRDTALGLLSQSLNTDWLWRFKQAQQLASATEPQSAQALLAGVR